MPQGRTKKALIVILVIVVLVLVAALVRGLVGGPSGERIGVVEIDGVITDSKETMEQIVKFKDDRTIKAVVLRINSPGGGVGPTQEIYREAVKLRDKKKVYVSMGSLCASGGYYIASAGERVYANPSTITGSIGVIMQLTVMEDLLKKLGLKTTTIKAGQLKDAGTPFREMTPEERVYLSSLARAIHEQFIADIAAGRKMEIQAAKKLADGRVFTGTQAKELGLVDAIGNFYDTVDELKKTTGIKGKPELVYGEKRFSLSRWLFSSFWRGLINELFSAQYSYLLAL